MLFNDPKTFREDMLEGYASAYSNYIVQVPGGVARATETPKGKVAVINGGGSGHYPAFCGIIGDGFMDATVVGNVFTSPSTEDVLNVAHAVENGGGIFIVGGNYAGDKMNFNLARDALIAEGIDARTFYITDDMASASVKEVEKRRGNVGTFTVFKMAGAASAAGEKFDDIVRITSKANDRTRTMSIGFKGCTLPGETEPKFHVPTGRMEVGQGIHGEAGVYESDLCSAATIAELLVEKVLSETPADDSHRIGVILNGLGSTKYEELFVVWKTVAQQLKERGYILVDPMVGEYVTSLDMAGIALSIIYLDDELEKYWNAPADTASFKKGSVEKSDIARRVVTAASHSVSFTKGSAGSREIAKLVVYGFEKMKASIIASEEKLAQIDSIAGDGDHGRGMVKGVTFAFDAAKEAMDNEAGAGSVIAAAGKAWAAKAGGTSGVLWGAALEAAGAVIGYTEAVVSTSAAAKAVRAAADKMMAIGQAHVGDKTMLDVLVPFAESLEKSAADGATLVKAWRKAATAAKMAAENTKDLLPKVGRARPQAERSLGTPDAGAVSITICIESVQ